MRNWLAVLIITALGVVATTPVWGLGFGDLDVHSALGQRLDAELQLLAVSAKERKSLSVQLASPAAYNQFGVHRGLAVRKVYAEVVSGNKDGRVKVLLTSDKPIREPFLVLLLEAKWSGNRALREYTLLLDPPSAPSESVSQSVTPKKNDVDALASATSQPETRSAPTTQPRPEANQESDSAQSSAPNADVASQSDDSESSSNVASQTATNRTSEPADQYGPVKADQTLWSIAETVRPDPSITMEQMMLAIYQANANKFDGNINSMYHDVMLTIPSAEQIRAIDPSTAESRIQQQMSAYISGSDDKQVASSKDNKDNEAAVATSSPSESEDSTGDVPSQLTAQDSTVVGTQPSNMPTSKSDSQTGSTSQTSNGNVATVVSKLSQTSESGDSKGAAKASTADTVAKEATSSDGKNNEQQKGNGYAVVGGIGVTRVSDQSAQTSDNTSEKTGQDTQNQQGKVADATSKDASKKSVSPSPASTESSSQIAESNSLVSSIMGTLTQYVPRNIVLGSLAVLAILVVMIILLLVIRFFRRQDQSAEWVDLDKDIDQSGQLDTTQDPELGIDSETDNKPRIEDILEDADTLMENDLHDDALSMISRGLESYPHESALVRKRLQVYWTLGDRKSFVEVVKHGDIAPNFEDPDWLQVAEWGHQLVPEEEVFMAPSEPDESESGQDSELEETAAEVGDADSDAPNDVDLEEALAQLDGDALTESDSGTDQAHSDAINIVDEQSAESGPELDEAQVLGYQQAASGGSAERRSAPGPAVKAALESATGQAAGYDPGVSVMMPSSNEGDNKGSIWGSKIDLSSFDAEGLTLESDNSKQSGSDNSKFSDLDVDSAGVSEEAIGYGASPAEAVPEPETIQATDEDATPESAEVDLSEEDLDLAASIEEAHVIDDPLSAPEPDPEPQEVQVEPQSAMPESGNPDDGEGLDVKLDLARAYIEVGDSDMAKSLLEEVRNGGTDEQRNNAEELLART